MKRKRKNRTKKSESPFYSLDNDVDHIVVVDQFKNGKIKALRIVEIPKGLVDDNTFLNHKN